MKEKASWKGAVVGFPVTEEVWWRYFGWQMILAIELPDICLWDKLNPHITIYYLGDVNEEKLELVKRVIEENKEHLRGESIQVQGVDAFINDHPALFINALVDEDVSIPTKVRREFAN